MSTFWSQNHCSSALSSSADKNHMSLCQTSAYYASTTSKYYFHFSSFVMIIIQLNFFHSWWRVKHLQVVSLSWGRLALNFLVLSLWKCHTLLHCVERKEKLSFWDLTMARHGANIRSRTLMRSSVKFSAIAWSQKVRFHSYQNLKTQTTQWTFFLFSQTSLRWMKVVVDVFVVSWHTTFHNTLRSSHVSIKRCMLLVQRVEWSQAW